MLQTMSTLNAILRCFLLLSFADGISSASPQSLFSSVNEIQIMPSIVAGLSILGGLVLSLYGYKIFRAALFGIGFTFGSVLVYEIMLQITVNVYAVWIGFLLGGLFFAYLFITFYQAGIFLAGALAGGMLASILHTSVLYRISPENPNTVLIISMVVLALVGGILATKIEKPALIVATALTGAIACVWGIGYFAGHYPSAMNLKTLNGKPMDSIIIPTEWWGYLAGTVALFGFGLYVQFGSDSKSYSNMV